MTVGPPVRPVTNTSRISTINPILLHLCLTTGLPVVPNTGDSREQFLVVQTVQSYRVIITNPLKKAILLNGLFKPVFWKQVCSYFSGHYSQVNFFQIIKIQNTIWLHHKCNMQALYIYNGHQMYEVIRWKQIKYLKISQQVCYYITFHSRYMYDYHIEAWTTWKTLCRPSLIARFMGPTWGPSGADRTQMGPMFAPWTLLSGIFMNVFYCRKLYCQ